MDHLSELLEPIIFAGFLPTIDINDLSTDQWVLKGICVAKMRAICFSNSASQNQ